MSDMSLGVLQVQATGLRLNCTPLGPTTDLAVLIGSSVFGVRRDTASGGEVCCLLIVAGTAGGETPRNTSNTTDGKVRAFIVENRANHKLHYGL